jgi:hypothetical protein
MHDRLRRALARPYMRSAAALLGLIALFNCNGDCNGGCDPGSGCGGTETCEECVARCMREVPNATETFCRSQACQPNCQPPR